MSFDQFFARIQSPALRQVAAHWQEACGDRLLPGWKQIDPAAIAPQLPIIWSWRYDRASDTFTGRLAGDAITLAFGRQLRGAALPEFFAGRNPDDVGQRYRRIVNDPAFMYGDGQVFRHAGRIGLGERIAMPLAEDGEIPDGIFGATTYSVPSGLYSEGPSGERILHARYVFFALRRTPERRDRGLPQTR